MSDKPRRHHTVSNFYLKRFANSANRLWVYDRTKNEYREQTPNNTSVEKDFYTFTDVDGNDSYELEELMGSEIEGKIPGIIEKIDEPKPISREEKEYLAAFVALQELRTTAYRKDHNEASRKFHKMMLKLNFANEAMVQKTLDGFEKETGQKVDVSAKELVELVQSDSIDVEIPRESHLKTMVELASQAQAIFLQMDWFFLRAPDATSFVTSDNPFTISAPKGHPSSMGVGLLTKGAEKLLPLSPRTCLAILDKGSAMKLMNVSRKDVRAINCRTVAACDRFICGRDRAWLERLVKITKIDQKERESRFQIDAPFPI